MFSATYTAYDHVLLPFPWAWVYAWTRSYHMWTRQILFPSPDPCPLSFHIGMPSLSPLLPDRGGLCLLDSH
eukprot:14107827-Ditylum_brightwellii.AAC.1